MTAAIPYQAMSVITASAATVTIVRSAAHTAKCVTPPCVLVVLMNVPAVMNRFVRVVLINVKNVKKCFVKTA